MKAGKPSLIMGATRPSAVIRSAHALGVPVAQIARECDIDAQALYRNAKASNETIRRIEQYLDAVERAA